MQKLLIATHNPNKVREYRALLADLPTPPNGPDASSPGHDKPGRDKPDGDPDGDKPAIIVTSLQDEGIQLEVDETGATLTENALLKARRYAEVSGLWTWADDSGLEVDALDGRPGVHSARYGGPELDDQGRYLYLLAELHGYDPAAWTARFRCVVALALPNGRVYTVEDTVEGIITDTPRGDNGFGYDPIFYLPERQMTMAQLSPETKNTISHRAKAAAAAKQLLAELLDREYK